MHVPDLRPLRHPDHLHVLLARVVRHNHVAPLPARAKETYLPSDSGVPFHVAAGFLFILPVPKVLGYARRFKADIVNYADDIAVLGRASAAEMLAAVETLMERLQLPMNAEKTRCGRVPEEPMTFLGYRIGRNYRPGTGTAYIGTRPSRESVQSLCRRVSALTTQRDLQLPSGMVVTRLNRLRTGWANYFILGQVGPAYAAIDQHATRRLRQWLGRKHKVRSGKNVRFSDGRLWSDYGLTRLGQRTTSFSWANA